VGGVRDLGNGQEERALEEQEGDEQPSRQPPGHRQRFGARELEPEQRPGEAVHDARGPEGVLVAGRPARGHRAEARTRRDERRGARAHRALDHGAEHREADGVERQVKQRSVEEVRAHEPPRLAESREQRAEGTRVADGRDRRVGGERDRAGQRERGSEAGGARARGEAVEPRHALELREATGASRDPRAQLAGECERPAGLREVAAAQPERAASRAEAHEARQDAHVRHVVVGRRRPAAETHRARVAHGVGAELDRAAAPQPQPQRRLGAGGRHAARFRPAAARRATGRRACT
jgi:hypothetical protein